MRKVNIDEEKQIFADVYNLYKKYAGSTSDEDFDNLFKEAITVYEKHQSGNKPDLCRKMLVLIQLQCGENCKRD